MSEYSDEPRLIPTGVTGEDTSSSVDDEYPSLFPPAYHYEDIYPDYPPPTYTPTSVDMCLENAQPNREEKMTDKSPSEDEAAPRQAQNNPAVMEHSSIKIRSNDEVNTSGNATDDSNSHDDCIRVSVGVATSVAFVAVFAVSITMVVLGFKYSDDCSIWLGRYLAASGIILLCTAVIGLVYCMLLLCVTVEKLKLIFYLLCFAVGLNIGKFILGALVVYFGRTFEFRKVQTDPSCPASVVHFYCAVITIAWILIGGVVVFKCYRKCRKCREKSHTTTVTTENTWKTE